MKETADKASTNEEEPSNSDIEDFESETGNALLSKTSKNSQPNGRKTSCRHRSQQNTRTCPLPFALGIRHVGERTAKTLAQAFGTLEHVRHAPEPILACLPDIGTVVARSIAHFFAQEAQQAMIDELLAVGVAPQSQAVTIPPLRHAEPQRWIARLPEF